MRNMNLKESKESERNSALFLQVPLQVPFSSLPYCNSLLSHTYDHQQEWIFSTAAIWSINTLQRNSQHQTPTVNNKTPNLLQWVNQPPLIYGTCYRQKWARDGVTLTVTCWVYSQEGITSPDTAPEELVSHAACMGTVHTAGPFYVPAGDRTSGMQDE